MFEIDTELESIEANVSQAIGKLERLKVIATSESGISNRKNRLWKLNGLDEMTPIECVMADCKDISPIDLLRNNDIGVPTRISGDSDPFRAK